VRIVAGRFRGKSLAAPKGNTTRPTSDRTREAIFNILEHAEWAPDLNGVRVIDAFAGSGALGFEALSRGAAFCLFVETDEAARGAIRTNVEATQTFGITRLHRRDATDLGRKPAGVGAPFDLIFLDPPYRLGLGEKALAGLAAGDWLSPGAQAIFEHAAEETPDLPPSWRVIDRRTWGAAGVTFCQLD
jgi:16S rRNA (guanine966-N2)-methyltransferase